MDFGEELEEYIILKLPINEYKNKKYSLEDGFEIVGFEARYQIRTEEKKLLQLYFRNWKIPYYNQLKGWRKESPLYIMYNGKLVSGLYVCSQNEFNEEGWGQLHYFFTDPKYKGKKLHSILVKEAIKKSKLWGLQGLIINTDRNLLPEVYIKWGASEWKKNEKKYSSMPISPIDKVSKYIEKIYFKLYNSSKK